MNQIKRDFTGPKCWPEWDIYFSSGVAFLQGELSSRGIQMPFFFLHLDAYTLRDFLLYYPQDADVRIVIISSQQLLPLAHFWMAKYRQVCAVFDSKTKIEDIVATLKEIPSLT